MGVLPSRESHEYPGAFHFAQSGNHAMAILPLTAHFFPSVDSLAFRQLYAGRDMQSAKYNFSLISPELLRKYRHRALEQWQTKKSGKGEATPSPPANRWKPQPYLRHGQPPDDDCDPDQKWIAVDTIDVSNYNKFFKDDTNCVSPNESMCPLPDGDEEVCGELQRPNPAAHWRVHEAAEKLVQENKLSALNEHNGLNSAKRESGLCCFPSSMTLSSSSGQLLSNDETHSASTGATAGGTAAADAVAAAAEFAAEERDIVNRFFARSPEALYNALVVEPNEGFLVDTNKEMCNLYAAEQRWKDARNVVRSYRRQCKQDDASPPAASTSPKPPIDPSQPRITKEEAEEAAKVPPPPLFLRPVPQVIIVRMSREEEEAARAAYFAKHQSTRSRTMQTAEMQSGGTSDLVALTSPSVAVTDLEERSSDLYSPTRSLNVPGDAKFPGSGDRGSVPLSPSPLHVPTTHHYRFEDDPKYKDGRIHLVEEEGVLYMFAYNTAYVDPRLSVKKKKQREDLLKQQQQQQQHERGAEKEPQTHEGTSKSGEACRSPLNTTPTVTSTAAEATARTAAAAAAAAFLTSPIAERHDAASTSRPDGDDDDDGLLCNTNRQTSSFYHTVCAFGNEEGEQGRGVYGIKPRRVNDTSPSPASATASFQDALDTLPVGTVALSRSTEEGENEEKDAALSSPSGDSSGMPQLQPKPQSTAALLGGDAPLARPDGKSASSSDDDDDDARRRRRRKNASALAGCVSTTRASATGTTPASARDKRSREVQQLELVTAAPYILPICPVRVVGCHGYAESSCRGTPWLRGYEDEYEEDAYVESLPVKPPIMSGGGFIDANVGDKILSRAYLLGFQVYRNVCLDAGLPETLTRPFWTLGLLSNIPLLQISREMRFRMRAAAAEVELGYPGLRDMIKGTENDLQCYIYGFSDILPYLERASRARVEQAEAEAKKAEAIEAGDSGGAAMESQGASSLPVGHGVGQNTEETDQRLTNHLPVSRLIPTRSSQTIAQKPLLFPRSEMEFYTQFTIRGNQTLARVRCEAQESFFRLISESTAPVSTSLFMKPLELSTYDYGGAVRLHLLYNRVTGADELQVLPPPRNLDQLISDHQQRLKLRRQSRTSAGGKEKPNSHASLGKGEREEETAEGDAAAAAAVPPYLVYTVVHPSGKARGPSLEHYKRNMQSPDDGVDANMLDEAEFAASTTTTGSSSSSSSSGDGDGKYPSHQYTYPPDSFVDSDMVIYNIHKGRWEHFEYFHHQQVLQRRARKLQSQAQKKTEEAAAAVEANDREPGQLTSGNPADVTVGKPAAQSGEAGNGAVVTSVRGNDGLRLEDDEDQQDIHLEDILLCWIKRRLQSATMRNRADPGWLRDSEGNIVQEGRYHIWGFEQDGQQYFYGLIPKFAKEKRNKRHSTTSTNAHHHNNDSHTSCSLTLGNLSGPLSAGNGHQRPQAGAGSDAGTPPALGTSSKNMCVDNAQERRRSTDGSGSNGSARNRHSASPRTRSPVGKMEDIEGDGSSELDTRPVAPLNLTNEDASAKQPQEQQHPGSPPHSVGSDSERGTVWADTGAASSLIASAVRFNNNSSDAKKSTRTAAQTNTAFRTGVSQNSSPLTSPHTTSTVITSTTTLTLTNNTPGVAGRHVSGTRAAASPSSSSSVAVASGKPNESEAPLTGKSGAAAARRGGPSHANPAATSLPPWSVVVGGAAAGTTGASPANPRTHPYRHNAANHSGSRGAASHEPQLTTPAPIAAQHHHHQSTSAPAAASYMTAEDVRFRQKRGERRSNGAELPYVSPGSQPRQQHHKLCSGKTSSPSPPPPAAYAYPPYAQQQHPEFHAAQYLSSVAFPLGSANPVPPPQQQQQQHTNFRTSDPGPMPLSYKGAPQSRYHGPQHQHQQMEYRQAPSSSAKNGQTTNNCSAGSCANWYPAASSQSVGHSASDMPPHPPPPPPPTSSPLSPLLPDRGDNAGCEQLFHGYPVKQQQQQPNHHHYNCQQQQLVGSPPPQTHLHPPNVYMNTVSGQASLRSTSSPAGPHELPPRHTRQQQQVQQQYASYDTRPYQQQQQQQQQQLSHVSHQAHSKTQRVKATVVASANVLQPELVSATYHHHHHPSQQYPQQIMTMPWSNAGPAAPPPQSIQASAAMNTSSTRYAPHTRMAASGSGASPTQRQHQQATPVTPGTVAPSPAFAGGNHPFSDASAASVAPSASRATPHNRPTPPQASYSPPSQTATRAMHAAELQGNAAPPHNSSYPSPPPTPQQQQQQQPHPHHWPHTHPSSAIMEKSTTAGQGAVASQSYGPMLSPAPQQHVCPQERGHRNTNYDGVSRGHNLGSDAAVTTTTAANNNNNTAVGGGGASSLNRVGIPLPMSAGTAKIASGGGAGTSILGNSVSVCPPSTGSGVGRDAQGYLPQPSGGYPMSGTAGLSPTSVVAAPQPSSVMMSGADGSAAKPYPHHQTAPYPPQQYQTAPLQQAIVSGTAAYTTAAGASSPAPNPYHNINPIPQQQQDAKYPAQTMMQSHTNNYNCGPATTSRKASRGVAVGSDAEDSSSYDDAMMHGSRGVHAAVSEYLFQYPQQPQQYLNSASPPPSAYATAPPPQQKQRAPHTGNGNANGNYGNRRQANPQASRSGAMANVNAPSAYADKRQISPYPQYATMPSTTSATSVGGGAGGAVATPAAAAQPSTAMQSANEYTNHTAHMTPASPIPAAAAQQQHPQHTVTRSSAAPGPKYYDAGDGFISQTPFMNTGGTSSGHTSRAHVLHQQPNCDPLSPTPGGCQQRQAPVQTQQPFAAPKKITPTLNASGTLLRTTPVSQQRYNHQYQRRQQEQEHQKNSVSSYANEKTHDNNMGTAETSNDSNNSTAAQRFAHNPYAMQ